MWEIILFQQCAHSCSTNGGHLKLAVGCTELPAARLACTELKDRRSAIQLLHRAPKTHLSSSRRAISNIGCCKQGGARDVSWSQSNGSAARRRCNVRCSCSLRHSTRAPQGASRAALQTRLTLPNAAVKVLHSTHSAPRGAGPWPSASRRPSRPPAGPASQSLQHGAGEEE